MHDIAVQYVIAFKVTLDPPDFTLKFIAVQCHRLHKYNPYSMLSCLHSESLLIFGITFHSFVDLIPVLSFPFLLRASFSEPISSAVLTSASMCIVRAMSTLMEWKKGGEVLESRAEQLLNVKVLARETSPET